MSALEALAFDMYGTLGDSILYVRTFLLQGHLLLCGDILLHF